MNVYVDFSIPSLLIFMALWYPLTITSYGTNIPAGLFVSGILIGCSMGRLMVAIMKSFVPEVASRASTYAVVGAASILSGYARHTISLAIIMMESTNSVNLFVPITFALLVASGVGGLFTRSIYVNSVRFKNVPFMLEEIPAG